jgi:hypothetical protein
MFHPEVNKPESSAALDEFGDKIRRPPRSLAQRDAETKKIFGVHELLHLVLFLKSSNSSELPNSTINNSPGIISGNFPPIDLTTSAKTESVSPRQ